MSNPLDIHVCEVSTQFIPVELRVPLKFGPETVKSAVCLRVKVTVQDATGKQACGWGETPLSVSWVWPGSLSVDERTTRMKDFSLAVADMLKTCGLSGHPMEIGHDFQRDHLLPT